MAEADDLEGLKKRILDAGPYADTPGHRRDVAAHLQRLGAEFSGRPALLLRHALLVVTIRRGIQLQETLDSFFALWKEQGEFLLRELDLRWLRSACDTLVDHGRSPEQRALAVSTSILVNLVKAYETERLLQSIPLPDAPNFEGAPGFLFDGLRAFKIGWDDTFLNLSKRVYSAAAMDALAGSILKEVFARLHRNDTALQRLLLQNRKPEYAWTELLPPEARPSGMQSAQTAAADGPAASSDQGWDMQIAEVAERIASNYPPALAGIPAQKLRPLIRAVFADLLQAIGKTDEGRLRFRGLGEFRVRILERDVEGRKILKKHVVFWPGS